MTHLLQLDPGIALRIASFSARDLRDLRKLSLINCAGFGEGVSSSYGDALRQRAAAASNNATWLLDGTFRHTTNLPWRRDTPLSEWEGVTCDARGAVRKIVLWNQGLRGSVDFAFLPPKVTHVNLQQNEIACDLDLSNLPASLRYLHLSHNMLTGSVSDVLSNLPASMKQLCISSNRLTGSVGDILSTLPGSMTILSLNNNRLTGLVPDLSKLPPKMVRLTLDDNRFDGVLDVRDVPSKCTVTFEGNNFSNVKTQCTC